MFSLASKLLSTIATPAFEKAYEKGCSIWDAKDELRKLQKSIQTIKAVLLDAEKKQESSAAVKDWVERVKDVLYDADDFFDEVATDEMLKQQIIKEDKLFKKVRAFSSKLNPVVSRNSIANRVKDIRKRLLEISTDMAEFNFVTGQSEEPIRDARQGRDPGSFVDSKDVVGRDEDKKVIFELLLDDRSNQDVSVIAIVGIGGMGKTTLAQLVYNDAEVMKNFENRWFACISDTSDDKEVIGEVFQSICDKKYGDFTLSQLQSKIRESVKGVKFLLVLDDVWDDDHGRWIKRMSLLNGGAKGSKIIVTTRSRSVARVVGALEAHKLEGLSENESWDLFKRVAFTAEQEKDPMWVNLGREIAKKCANVPLAIRSVGSLLYTKDTIEEWKSFIDIELSKVELNGDQSVMQTLKLSYDHLPVNLKPCFAYCSLFPKDHCFVMDDLIYLWIAQGYIKPIHEMQTVEQTGYSYFMDLHRRYFFEREIYSEKYKMHDLIHDLAQCVAGEEIIALIQPTTQLNKRARHVSIGLSLDTSRILDTNRLRSLLFLPRQLVVNENRQFTYGKCLRALSLSGLRIHTVSSCIGELKHLRYFNLSNNPFESLPNSLTNLLNLLKLDINHCDKLKSLPDSFRKLINLRHLNIEMCNGLRHMPPGMGELTCLQKLSDFNIGKAIEGVQTSGLDELAGLQLRGCLDIWFYEDIDNWDGDQCWKLPVSLEHLCIHWYSGRRIPRWSNHPSFIPNLAILELSGCPKVKYLPPLRCLPNLKSLELFYLEELEYIEEEEVDPECTTVAAGYITNNSLFFPLLEELQMSELPKLKGWSRKKVEATTASSAISASLDLCLSFPLLCRLTIDDCKELLSFPQCPSVRSLVILNVDYVLLQQWFSTTSTSNSTSPSSLEDLSISYCQWLVSFPAEALSSLEELFINKCDSLENLSLLVSPLLKALHICECNGLTSVEVEALPSLASLRITGCRQLKSLRIARLNALQKFNMLGCPKELELWGRQQEKRCVDWDSLPNLSQVIIDQELPSLEELPDCLRQQQALGQLRIRVLHNRNI